MRTVPDSRFALLDRHRTDPQSNTNFRTLAQRLSRNICRDSDQRTSGSRSSRNCRSRPPERSIAMDRNTHCPRRNNDSPGKTWDNTDARARCRHRCSRSQIYRNRQPKWQRRQERVRQIQPNMRWRPLPRPSGREDTNHHIQGNTYRTPEMYRTVAECWA
jgi:hypothetical protein